MTDSLHTRRIQQLLKHGFYFWLVSASLAGLIILLVGQFSLVLGAIQMSLSVAGLLFNAFCLSKKNVSRVWSPINGYSVLVALAGIGWALTMVQNPFNWVLGLFSLLAGSLALASHGRLIIMLLIPASVIPIGYGLWLGTNTLNIFIHCLGMEFVGATGFIFSTINQRVLRFEGESERLEALFNSQQADLKNEIDQRTQALDEANRELALEAVLRKDINAALLASEERLNLTMSASGIGYWDWDVDNRTAYHSDVEQFFPELEGINSHSLDLSQYVSKADQLAIRRSLSLLIRGKSEQHRVRYRVNLPNNQIRWLEDIGQVVERDERGRARRVIGTRRDMTGDMTKQEELSLSSSLFENSNDGVFILDEYQRFKTVNRPFSELMGQSKQQLAGTSFLDQLSEDHRNTITEGLYAEGEWSGEIHFDAHVKTPIRLTLSAINRSDGTVAHYLGICRVASRGSDRVISMAPELTDDHDQLTGLYNRRFFINTLKGLRENHQDNSDAIAVINLDRFKSINDSLGPNIGDEVLKDVAARLGQLPAQVTAIARLSADEFAILIHFADNDLLLADTLDLVQETIMRPSMVDEHELILTASIGVCVADDGHAQQWLEQATSAMNTARLQGGNAIEYFHQKLSNSPIEREHLINALRKAVKNNEFSVNYQPKLNLHTQLIDSVEALVRWRHPQKGIISPSEFLPLAEEAGLIAAIGNQVLLNACEEAAGWRARGFGDIHLSVNLSSHQIRGDDAFDLVSAALTQSKLPGELLEVEVTENMLMADIEHSQSFLNRLRSLGVRIVLDDFGSGSSSIGALKRLPLDTLKIDRAFVGEARHGQSSAVAEAIMAMADSLKLQVVAEGVETQAQLNYVKKLGCDYAQGFIISQPLPASEVLALIRHTSFSNMSDYGETALH